jgi:hypothetical protein
MPAVEQQAALQTPTLGQVLSKYQLTAPVDVVGLAKDLGLTVWSMELPPNISGKIFRDSLNGGKSGFSIIVNAGDVLYRQRFTIAHEIAHFILHRQQLEKGGSVEDDAMYRSGLSTREEVEANRFAAQILMPMALIQKLIAQGVKDVPSLAERFQVSQPAMKIRLGIPVT